MIERRKTFREYLLEGGIKGVYFSTSAGYPYRDRKVIKIIDIIAGRGSDAVHFQMVKRVL